MLLAVSVQPADVQDRVGAELVLAEPVGRFPRPWVIWADGGYAGRLPVRAPVTGGWVIEPVKKPAGATAFAAHPNRWIADRAFARLGRNRRLRRDDGALPDTGEARIRLAMIHLVLKRLAPR